MNKVFNMDTIKKKDIDERLKGTLNKKFQRARSLELEDPRVTL